MEFVRVNMVTSNLGLNSYNFFFLNLVVGICLLLQWFQLPRVLDEERGKLKVKEALYNLIPILRALGKEDIRSHSQAPSGYDFWGNTFQLTMQAEEKLNIENSPNRN